MGLLWRIYGMQSNSRIDRIGLWLVRGILIEESSNRDPVCIEDFPTHISPVFKSQTINDTLFVLLLMSLKEQK